MRTGSRTFRFLPSSASALTQSEFTDRSDHTTTTHLAQVSACSMTRSNDSPVGILRSHQTDQPRDAKAFANPSTQGRSSLL